MSIFDRPIGIGLIVHYVMRAEDYLPGATRSGYEHRPAIVVDPPLKAENPVLAWPVNLQVIRADGDGAPDLPAANPFMMWRTGVVYSSDHLPGTWHWPE